MRNHLKELFILRLKNMQNRPKNFENRLENLKTHQKKEKKNVKINVSISHCKFVFRKIGSFSKLFNLTHDQLN